MSRFLCAVLLCACGEPSGPVDAAIDAPSVDASGADASELDAPGLDAPRPDAGPGTGFALRFVRNATRAHEWGEQVTLPPAFGAAEFTLELFVRLDDAFPVGSTAGGDDQLTNWSDADEVPYGDGDWWYAGNFLLDGHNNASFSEGTFSLQLYGGGRVRWLFGDGAVSRAGGVWSVGAHPASSTPSLLDGAWHRLAMVRRFAGATTTLELWIDGAMVDAEVVEDRADMTRYWADWSAFPAAQRGWFWGAEKQAAIGVLDQYEDYKGDLAEIRFWSRARSTAELADWDAAVDGSESGLVGWIPFDERTGDRACDALDRSRCIVVRGTSASLWTSPGPPLR